MMTIEQVAAALDNDETVLAAVSGDWFTVSDVDRKAGTMTLDYSERHNDRAGGLHATSLYNVTVSDVEYLETEA